MLRSLPARRWRLCQLKRVSLYFLFLFFLLLLSLCSFISGTSIKVISSLQKYQIFFLFLSRVRNFHLVFFASNFYLPLWQQRSSLCLWTNYKLFAFFLSHHENTLMVQAEFVARNFCNITFLRLRQRQNGSLNFWGQIRSTLTCTQTCNTYLYTRTHTDVDNKHALVHCLDLTLGIDAVWSIVLASLTSHTLAAVKRRQWQRWSFCVSGKLSKGFGVWQQSVSESIFESYLSSHRCFLLLIVSPAEVLFVLCSVVLFFLPSLCELFTAAAQGCIHQSSRGTTANWFSNRISLLPAISLHYDFS